MSNSSTPSHKLFKPIWKLLVSLMEIDIDPTVAEEKVWELTKLYSIPSDISEKIIISIQNVSLGAFGTFDTLQVDRHIFMNVYISAKAKKGSLINHSWGFFQIERINAVKPKESYIRLVELYLYLEP